MHERILNPFLLFKAAENDMFSVFMNTSFNNALLKKTPKYAHGDKTHAEPTVWCPIVGADNPVVADSTRQGSICKKPSSQLKTATAHKTPAAVHPRAPCVPGDFVLVNNWDSYANTNAKITAASALLLVHCIDDGHRVQHDTDNEADFDFVFVDSE